jgi:hypothetical protein
MLQVVVENEQQGQIFLKPISMRLKVILARNKFQLPASKLFRGSGKVK